MDNKMAVFNNREAIICFADLMLRKPWDMQNRGTPSIRIVRGP